MSAVFINPQLIVQQNDKFTTGIVYMPITLAYVIASFKKNNIKTKLIDLYGSNPTNCFKQKKSLIFGNSIRDIDQTELKNANCFFINANQIGNHSSILEIIKFLKKEYPSTPIVMLENAQAVTAYSLSKIKDEFLNLDCQYILIGDLENTAIVVYKNLKNIEYLSKIDGIITKYFCNNKINFIENLNEP